MNKTQLYPLIFIVFAILGIIIFEFTNETYSLIISLLLGFILMLVEIIGPKKTRIQTLNIWICALFIMFILFFDIFI
jgi:hypothetical protein